MDPGSRICAGIDGARGGWVGWLVEAACPDRFRPLHAVDLQALIAALPADCPVWIDMPIGLASGQPRDDGRRTCDRAARQRIGGRLASRVFTAPIRAVLAAGSYAEACRISQDRTGQALSLQAWNICAKIRAVDAFVREHAAGGRIREAHPELAFAALNGDHPIAANKRSAAGRAARLARLAAHGVRDADDRIRAARQAAGGHRFSAYDDWLDALALAVGFSEAAGVDRLPAEATRDAFGLPVHIHVPKLSG